WLSNAESFLPCHLACCSYSGLNNSIAPRAFGHEWNELAGVDPDSPSPPNQSGERVGVRGKRGATEACGRLTSSPLTLPSPPSAMGERITSTVAHDCRRLMLYP